MLHVVCGIRGKNKAKKKNILDLQLRKTGKTFPLIFFPVIFCFFDNELSAPFVQSNDFFPIIIKRLPDHLICCKLCAPLISSNRTLCFFKSNSKQSKIFIWTKYLLHSFLSYYATFCDETVFCYLTSHFFLQCYKTQYNSFNFFFFFDLYLIKAIDLHNVIE